MTFLPYNRHSTDEGRIKCPNMIVCKCMNAIHVYGVGGLSGRHILWVPTEEVHHGGESRFGKNSAPGIRWWIV